MARATLDGNQRLTLIIKAQREIAAADGDLQTVMQLIAERSQAIVEADGAMVNLIEGENLHTRGASGIATAAGDAVRPISSSVARYAIESGQPLLIEDAPHDPRVNQELRAKVGDESLICVPLRNGAEVIGTLNVMSRDADQRLDHDDREILEMLSVVLSAAVARAAQLDARQEEAKALTRFRTLFEGASIGIVRMNRDGTIVEVNPALEHMLETDAALLVGRAFSEHLVSEHRMTVEALLREMMAGRRESFELEGRCQPPSGQLTWWRVRAVRERSDQGTATRAVAMIEDITEHKHAERELIEQAALNEYQALHDPLTGLPNRVLFGERIGQAIRHARRNRGQLAVLLMDLDRFKEVNDSLGHPAGDQLLIEVSDRIRGAIRDSDTFARLGGDEFGLLLPELNDSTGVMPVLDRITAALEAPITVHTLPLAVEASIGIAMYPENGEEAQELIQRADVAMYEAKRESASACFFDQETHQYDTHRLTLVGELRRAIEREELVLHYQPKAMLNNSSIRSVEALVRWQHPSRGLIFPDAFIPIAQETSLIGPLTLHVVAMALRQGRIWRDDGLDLTIAVNLSTRNLLDRELPHRLQELLKRANMPATSLELEVTESSMLANPKRAKVVLGELSALGIRLSIDDFGTGYSSLCYLRELPIDEIKIDRSFVMRMNEEHDDVAIVRSTIDLGRNLGLDVVAEGVETREIWDKLQELGCQTAQGYYLSRPVPAEVLTEWLEARSQLAVATAAAE
ncbi:MAG TPA: EAL domain-containing protein [Solirubrobacteraceae bacterium]|nr:EAL domain-containing protein [Solirubrobacteraceae bacterium]